MELIIPCIPLWFELSALACCLGSLMFMLWVIPPAEATSSRDQGALRPRLWIFFSISLAVILTCSSADLLSRTAEMSGEPLMSAFSSVPTVLFKTHAGLAWLVRAACLILIAVLIAAGRRHRDSRMFLFILFLLCALIALTESASGHASDKGDFTVSEMVDWLHLLGASFWAGGIFVLSLIILPHAKRSGASPPSDTASVVIRFSRIAGIAVLFVVLTALYNAWQYVGSINAAVRTGYGLTVVAKAALLFLLLLLAAFTRYAMVPLFADRSGVNAEKSGLLTRLAGGVLARFSPDKTGERVLDLFKRSVRLEAILMICLLFCASLLRHEIPARHALHHSGSGTEMHRHMH